MVDLLSSKSNCCGCEVCKNICPKQAISFEQDREGFIYPRIDKSKCVECGLCKKECAFQITMVSKGTLCTRFQNIYAVKHTNMETRMNSRSGGIFTAISDIVLDNDGAVYGASYGQGLEVRHVRATSKTERNTMRGSKYVQSKTDDSIYRQVKKDLENGKEVLYSGTSCQIAALRNYLGRTYENLICVDIVCHGVPSPRIYKDYLQYWENKLKTEVINIDFRNKKSYGWAGHVETIFTSKKQINSCIYTMLFYQHNILRPSCYVCPYKGLEHPGDITIADYWGIDKVLPGFSDNKGVSLVLTNTFRGAMCLKMAVARGYIEAIPTDIEKSMQPPLKEPFKCPSNRMEFWGDYENNGFKYIAKKYAGDSWKWIWKYRMKKILMDLHLYKVIR